MDDDINSTLQKALEINLDPHKYGTIAEIGAGQEIARFFFQAGGAAGTLAKTMSAYEMQFSDAIYGEEENGRYVSRSRLEKMLEKEFRLLGERVRESRPKNSCFFAIADTVKAAGYKSRGQCHGWVGIRAQLYPGAPPSDIILHVRMLDKANRQQQYALGVLGVNLLYGAFYHYRSPEQLVESLSDNLERGRIEINMIHFQGPYFDEVDNRLMALHLVKSGMAGAVMFSPDGEVLPPSDALYKKHCLLFRGSYRPITNVNMDMARCGKEQFFSEEDVDEAKTVTLAELTMANLMNEGEIDTQDFLARVDMLSAQGFSVLISNYLRFFRLRSYLNEFTKRKIGIVLGVPNIQDIFDEKYYTNMEGGILEAFGKLFSGNIRLYVYPVLGDDGELVTLENIRVDNEVRLLLRHLMENGCIVPLEGANTDVLQIKSRDVLMSIRQGRTNWKDAVPEVVYETIVKQRLFNFDSE
ncbi:MAG: TonB-dependent receptor [Candidatus Hydrogenedentes bacterium]|nr:TonB-dependent receptor [Candidatus Hydrogenedentota bacterium]